MGPKLSDLIARAAVLWPPIQADLRGLRRALLMLSILLFTIMLLEVDLGHRPALAEQTAQSWLAFIPVVWLPITLIALMAVQIRPSLATMLVALAVTAIAAGVGMIGSGLHMMAAGVDFEHLGRVFSSTVWGGRVSPNWPVAITVASVLGFIASLDAHHNGEGLPRDAAGAVTAVAYLLIVAGIALAPAPALVMVSAVCLATAALLLVGTLIGMLAGAAMQGSVS
jgi:hypothetical protein